MSSADSKPSQLLTLQIAEQPAKLHRFRYLKEIKESRMGSILHSRGSAKVKVKVSGLQSVTGGCSLKLVGCTLFDDLSTHPFYLFGDDCRAGVFEKEFAGVSECTVSLDRVGIVCTRKKATKAKATAKDGDGQEEDTYNMYRERAALYNFFNRTPKANPFQGKDANKLRLAFQVFLKMPGSNEWVAASNCTPVASDAIGDAKIFSEMTVDCVIPKTVTRLDQDVWLYMKDPLPAETAHRFKVVAEDQKQQIPLADLPVKSVKKHLVVFDFSSIRNLSGALDLTVQVVDKDTGESSQQETVTISLPDESSTEPASKRSRTGISHIATDGDLLDELMENFQDGESIFLHESKDLIL